MCDSKRDQILLNCYHCGNKGLLNIVGQHEERFGGPITDPAGNQIDFEIEETFSYFLLSCPACRSVVLYQRDTDETMCGTYNDKILYPRNTTDLDGVPENIKRAFESAVKVESISEEICLLSLRRTLEMICKEKSAVGKSLPAMIKDLVDKKIMPEALNDACSIIRVLGNEAAHADKSSVAKHDVEEVIGFVETIIDYIYSLPNRIYRLKRTIDSRSRRIAVTSGIASVNADSEE